MNEKENKVINRAVLIFRFCSFRSIVFWFRWFYSLITFIFPFLSYVLLGILIYALTFNLDALKQWTLFVCCGGCSMCVCVSVWLLTKCKNHSIHGNSSKNQNKNTTNTHTNNSKQYKNHDKRHQNLWSKSFPEASKWSIMRLNRNSPQIRMGQVNLCIHFSVKS